MLYKHLIHGKYVIVVNDDGSTTNTNVETGISNDDYIEIKSGITAGTKVQIAEKEETSSERNGFDRGNGGMREEGGMPNFEGENRGKSGQNMP